MDSLKSKIKRKYIQFGIAAVVLFVVVFSIILSQILDQNNDAFLINKSGKQRMLSQNIAKVVYAINAESTFSERQNSINQLKLLASEIEVSHHYLYTKFKEDRYRNDRLDSLFNVLTAYLDKILTSCESVIDSENSENLKKGLSAIVEAEAPYLITMDAIVDEYQSIAEGNTQRLKIHFYVLSLLSFLLLFGGFFYLFKPTVRQLIRKNEDLVLANSELETSKSKIKKNLSDLETLKQELEASNHYNRIFIEQAPPSLAMLDKDMRYIAVSKKWKTDYKMEGVDIIGRSHYDIFPEIGEDWKERHRACLNGATDVCDEASFVRLDGTTQWIFWDVRPWYNEVGEIGGLLMYTGDITHLKEQREAKIRAEEILDNTTKVARIGTWELDLKTDEYTLSNITKEILKFPIGYEVKGNDSLLFYKEGASRDRIIKHVNELVKTGKPFDIEVEVVDFQGNTIWVRDIGQAEFSGNECVKIFGIFQDISDVKQSEAELLRKNQLLSFAEKISLMGNWQWDVVNNTVKWSSNLYRIFGLDESEMNLTYETYFNFVHPNDKEKVTGFVEKSIAEKKFPNNFIHRIVTSTGEVKTVHLLGEVFEEEGEVVELIGTCQDVTEQRLAEIKFRGLLESAPDAMVIINHKGNIHLINKQAEYLFGYTVEELVDKPIETLIPNKIMDEFIKYRDGFFKDPKSIRMADKKELIGINKKGGEFPVQISLSPLQTEEGLLVSAAIRDVTLQKRSEQKIINTNESLQILTKKLKRQNTQLADFAHITSHNLRAPVSNLNSLLDIYQNSDDAEERVAIFQKLEKVISHLTLTLNTLVEAIKIKNEDVNKEDVYFNETLNKTKELLTAQISETEAVITSDFSAVNKVAYNKIYFESIFLNLIENAIKYKSKERKPQIHLVSSIDEGKIVLKVSDNGLGIDLKRHGHKLFGLNKVFHRHPDAKGVGLFMTKLHVESMGGTIKAESNVNVGTTFIINFN
ncbi:PAS domain S-box protein [Winogradskyella sp.]|uniref:PAS domain S-box protein n=1 Tax=Winogradskyella sp. TaxID=1883156 RepID=UPI002609F6D9|nr:PAS domain S-box protein [uncultured Winogradskyella sp.]